MLTKGRVLQYESADTFFTSRCGVSAMSAADVEGMLASPAGSLLPAARRGRLDRTHEAQSQARPDSMWKEFLGQSLDNAMRRSLLTCATSDSTLLWPTLTAVVPLEDSGYYECLDLYNRVHLLIVYDFMTKMLEVRSAVVDIYQSSLSKLATSCLLPFLVRRFATMARTPLSHN